MMSRRILTALVLALPFLAGAGSALARCVPPQDQGTPPVRGAHIFCGEVRRDGRAVGFHSRPGGRDPASVSDTGDRRPDRRRPGIYSLFGFQITEDGRTGTKALSTMFPDHCDATQVLAAIRHAWRHGNHVEDKFSGWSGDACRTEDGQPFRIEGFTASKGGNVVIVTGFPAR